MAEDTAGKTQAYAWWIGLAILLLMNIKNLPFMWHVRFIRALTTRLRGLKHRRPLSPECLFLPAISATRAPLTECDYNFHKSNSTYFTDLDISRGNHSLLLFGSEIMTRYGQKKPAMILGGVKCVFRKEIKPYQGYELWTRVLSWDEKWIYIVSHFVERDQFVPEDYYLQPRKKPGPRNNAAGKPDVAEREPLKKIFASSISRYVFKEGRVTVPPEKILRQAGLLPVDLPSEDGPASSLAKTVEDVRRERLAIAQLRDGWDGVHALFKGKEKMALGRYTDLLWR
ncbi:hypothetical protein BFW01_g9418 [Lasiodiplodia theobromae]|uniref:Protein THEM6 n=1 Tax=Lasiodiplodia theobromae TaxID=45133 RepID=A0A5N5DJC1_9PEZI|nr:uncharacterized protein LTHEOB_11190 [Lasiodiplodia theobromae]KAB2577953.1 Uncharacterized protein DBV05_g3457 [Lasiodiplodia theobromae]KAF4538065.1 hypothetical protein LTHEOB_11190 [Lasiodiplodia theobromae]KAF9638521.1 hypothetical protein BFW01_g9418 [Lasiodiplodia theobromae]